MASATEMIYPSIGEKLMSNKKISDKAKARWASLSDERYWEIVDAIKAGGKRHWAGLSEAQRLERTKHLAAARAKSIANRQKVNTP